MDMASTNLTRFAINGTTPAAPGRIGDFEVQDLTADLLNSESP